MQNNLTSLLCCNTCIFKWTQWLCKTDNGFHLSKQRWPLLSGQLAISSLSFQLESTKLHTDSLKEGTGTCPTSNRKSVACRFSDSPQLAQQTLDQSSSNEEMITWKAMEGSRVMINSTISICDVSAVINFHPNLRVWFLAPCSVKNWKNCLRFYLQKEVGNALDQSN